MTIEDLLKAYILEQYKSVREFAASIGVPQSTVANILIRGLENAGYDRVIEICKGLKISSDALANGEIVSSSEVERLSSEEQILLCAYRKADQRGKHIIQEIAKLAYNEGSEK